MKRRVCTVGRRPPVPCFSARQTSDTAITGEFRTDCLRAAGGAATEILGASGATAFVAALEADLNEDHTHDAGL
jgi:hypothetical protein